MLRISSLALSALLAFSLLGATSQPYEIKSAAGDRLELKVDKTGLMKGKQHVFVFDRYRGALSLDTAQPEQSRISLTIEAGSVRCLDTWVKSKDLEKIQTLTAGDMLAVDRHPEIAFTSSEVRQVSPDHYEVRGSLTIRGTSRPSLVNVTTARKPDQTVSFQGSAVVRLSDYGLKPPSAALGAVGTKDEMLFNFALTAMPRHE